MADYTLTADQVALLADGRTHLDTLAQDHGDDRFLLLTHCGALGLYQQQTADRWIYAALGLLGHNDNTNDNPKGDAGEEAP